MTVIVSHVFNNGEEKANFVCVCVCGWVGDWMIKLSFNNMALSLRNMNLCQGNLCLSNFLFKKILRKEISRTVTLENIVNIL